MSEPPRSRETRALAEAALARLVWEYGETPEFVLLGGLVPDLLCSSAARPHIGTTDVDVQVDLEIEGGSAHATRLESALKATGFAPDDHRVWQWRDHSAPGIVVTIEFLADLEGVADQSTVAFTGCDSLGAVNLRGTGFASRDWNPRSIAQDIDGERRPVDLRVASLPAYLLAKTHAAYGRGLEKDWYDIAYVLLHNDEGGPRAAASRVRKVFGGALVAQTATALRELGANFADGDGQGAPAYARTMHSLHPDLDADVLANDAVAGVAQFLERLALQEPKLDMSPNHSGRAERHSYLRVRVGRRWARARDRTGAR